MADLVSDIGARLVQPNRVSGSLPAGQPFPAPTVPTTIAACGVSEDLLLGLTLKTGYTVPRFTTEWMTGVLRLASSVTAQLLERMRTERLIEVLGQVSAFNYQFAVTDRGREHARRLLETSQYVGPAPVSLADYSRTLEQQFACLPTVERTDVLRALSPLVLDPETLELAGLAASSRRSLFLFGPPGNGKTTLGHLLHEASRGYLWIPYAISADDSLIRVYDQQCHRPAPVSDDATAVYDRRWVRIQRPFIVVGGELTLDSLDLAYSRARGSYEAPLHFKANGGTFLLDDFGCQRDAPADLLNRWIHPLERNVDFLTLLTGQQIQVPFRQMLIVSTNRDPQQVMSPAFLRRMGYRILLDSPTDEQYGEIFRRYASSCGVAADPGLLDWLMRKYRAAGRSPAACEPRDLIERALEICRYRSESLRLSQEFLEIAWHGYFGEGVSHDRPGTVA